MLWQNKLAWLHILLLYIFIITALANKMLELSLNKFPKKFIADVFADNIILTSIFWFHKKILITTKSNILAAIH
jgi:hypothetical protein